MQRKASIRMVAAVAAFAIGAATQATAQNRRDDGAGGAAGVRDRVSQGSAPAAADRDRLSDRDRDRLSDRDRDRLTDRDQDRLNDRDQDRLTDRDRARDRDTTQSRDPDQLHLRDRDQLRDRDIYGSELMTRRERDEYRDRIETMASVREWAQFRSEHQAQMVARASERGANLPAPYYGQQLMTDRERERMREQLQSATSEQVRQQVLAEHRELMQQRARENGIPLRALGGQP